MQDNKISLSMKQTEQPQQQQRTRNQNGDAPHARSQQRPPRRDRDRPNVWQPPKPKPPMSELSFEDMLSQFKQNSEERICDIKRNTERKNVPEESKFAFGRNTKETSPLWFSDLPQGGCCCFSEFGSFQKILQENRLLMQQPLSFADGIHAGKPSMQSAAE